MKLRYTRIDDGLWQATAVYQGYAFIRYGADKRHTGWCAVSTAYFCAEAFA